MTRLSGPHSRQGWFIAVSPGTRQVTVGGAIAADVHGKNHHRDGSFCSSVTSLTLVTPTGIRTVGPESDPELFWATAGGMGLTGVVVKATLRLTRVETAWVIVDTERFADLDDAMSAMEATDHGYRFSVAWVDCSSHRRGAGRSVLTRGDYAPFDSLRPGTRSGALALPRVSRLRVPCSPPGRLVNRHSLRTFNALWFHKSPRRRFGELMPLTSFLHPLDGVADWNLLYGPRGFVQYQFVVAPHHGEVVRQVISMVASSGVASSMAVLKRFGPADPGPLSFPMEGWTLALDFPAGLVGLPALLNRLDEVVAAHGGRVYLAKDARLRPELLSVMYPRLKDFVEVLRRVDPDGRLQLGPFATPRNQDDHVMNDAFNHPQSVLVLGGSSEIAGALVDRLVANGCRTVILAGRDPAALENAAKRARDNGARTVGIVVFNALDVVDTESAIGACFDAIGESVDLVLVTLGLLGDAATDVTEAARIVENITVNFVWPAAALGSVAQRLRDQGYGRIVVFSSVAGVRIRETNFIYGSAKSGLDGYAIGLAETLRGSGVQLHIVRPGFVRTKMTEGLHAAPFCR